MPPDWPRGDDGERAHQGGAANGSAVDDDFAVDYPWLAHRDERFTLALVLDVGEVLVRHS